MSDPADHHEDSLPSSESSNPDVSPLPYFQPSPNTQHVIDSITNEDLAVEESNVQLSPGAWSDLMDTIGKDMVTEQSNVEPSEGRSNKSELSDETEKKQPQVKAKKFRCPRCPSEEFDAKYLLTRHNQEKHPLPSSENRTQFQCPYCPLTFNNEFDLNEHGLKTHRDAKHCKDWDGVSAGTSSASTTFASATPREGLGVPDNPTVSTPESEQQPGEDSYKSRKTCLQTRSSLFDLGNVCLRRLARRGGVWCRISRLTLVDAREALFAFMRNVISAAIESAGPGNAISVEDIIHAASLNDVAIQGHEDDDTAQ